MSESAIGEELATVDTSVLDELTRIKQEVDTLDDRLKAMEEKKDSVAEAVYQRVKGDYQAKRKQLESEASPLKEKARAQYAKLFALLSRSEADHEAARLDREEVEFRHTLGEFDQDEFDRRIADIDQKLQAKADVREQAMALRERFVAAFKSEDDLRAATPEPAPKPAAVPAPEVKAEAATPLSNTVIDPNATQPPPPAAQATVQLATLTPQQLADPNATIPPPSSNMPPPAPPSGGDPGATQAMRVLKGAGAAAAAPRADQTVIIRGARLVPQNPEAGKLTHTVGLKPVTIGSAEDCDVRVAGVAQKHAEIRVSMAGYTVSDLGGGVRINGVVVEQHLMRHDDVLEIGPARFTFREG